MLKTKKPSISRTGAKETEKNTAVSRKKTVARKKRSAAKTATGKKVTTRKKVSKKRVAAASTSPASPKGGTRKGRPVSVDVLQRKLAASVTALKAEKKKRQQLAKNAKLTTRKSVTERRNLKKQITELKKSLSALLNEKKSAEKQAAQQQKMDIARNQAVGKFMERWEKNHQKKTAVPAKNIQRRKRVRRAVS